jgi:hypothetical protein
MLHFTAIPVVNWFSVFLRLKQIHRIPALVHLILCIHVFKLRGKVKIKANFYLFSLRFKSYAVMEAGMNWLHVYYEFSGQTYISDVHRSLTKVTKTYFCLSNTDD